MSGVENADLFRNAAGKVGRQEVEALQAALESGASQEELAEIAEKAVQALRDYYGGDLDLPKTLRQK